ncbi:galactose-binding domain-like protein [Schizophyllum commune]
MATSLLTKDTVIKVSSTLDKSVGKKNLIDGSPETCWTSQQGLPQYVQVVFDRPAKPGTISLTFQGGFVGKTCVVSITQGGTSDWQEMTRIYPEDVNRQQTFTLSTDLDLSQGAERLRLTFEESTDFFGRITIYDLKILGSFVSA